MDRRHLQAVWKLAADGGPAVPDADLLRRYARDRCPDAFAELVRRHGRLVWALCRNLLPSEADADDAFQATFLALARSAGSVRDAARLGPWLHGVAYRVCLKARRSAARRKRRERAAAVAEAGRPVADAAWDAALAAVHEEVARLPEPQRVAFVLCCLEGKGATEAAEQLGWKLGTLSGRLTRAKQTLLARLADRGVSAAVVASAAVAGGSASAGPPAAVAARTAELVLADDVVPKSILTLSQGVTGMALHRTKLLAAAVLVAGGLAAGAGSGWLATADAQSPPKPAAPVLPAAPAKPAAEAERKARQAQADVDDLARKLSELMAQKAKVPALATNEFYYVPRGGDAAVTPTEFEAMVRDHEGKGWEFLGVVEMTWAGPVKGGSKAQEPSALPTFVFRRPAARPAPPTKSGLAPAVDKPAAREPKPGESGKTGLKQLAQKAAASADEQALQAEVKRLTAELAALRGGPKEVRLAKSSLSLSPHDMQRVLATLAAERFGTDGKKPLTLEASDTELTLRGSAEVVDWAADMARKLSRPAK